MDLNTIREVKRPASPQDIVRWQDGYAWLAGGTWLFSEPQFAVDTLIDLDGFGWQPIEASASGLEIAATCHISAVEHFQAPPEWTAAPLLKECAHALLMSFKIANVATVGGNICMSLPAGAMISLTTALEGVYTLWPRNGPPRQVAAIDFVTGNHANILAEGELLRSIHLPASALTKRFAMRRASLTHLGRSSVFVIGTRSQHDNDLLITITASTFHPVQLRFAEAPTADVLRQAIDDAVPAKLYYDDVNGTPAYREHLTYHFAEEIRAELAASGAQA